MVDTRSQDLLARLESLGEVSQSQALSLVDEIYSDGIVSQGEADGLFALNRQLKGSDAQWERRFIEAISDFLLGPMAQPRGWVSDEGADWLIGAISHTAGPPRDSEIDLMVVLCRKADGVPCRLSRFALTTVADTIRRMGHANAWNVERLRQILHAPAGEEGLWVSRFEANTLFALNDSIAFANNDRAWNDLFARAIANHLLAAAHPAPESAEDALRRQQWLSDTTRSTRRVLSAMVSSFSEDDWFARITADPDKAVAARNALKADAASRGAEITQEESRWFMKRLGWNRPEDSTISPAERALVSFLNKEVPGFTRGLAVAS